MSKTKTKPEELGAAGATIILGRIAEMPPPAPPIAELIARFQLETETGLKDIRAEMHRLVTEQARTVAALRDEWTVTRDEVGGLRKQVESALHEMRAGITEAITAAKSASASSQKAAESAAVFDKLKASQPDFHRMVADQNRTIADVRTRFEHLEERLGGLSKRLDELDAVAVDYEDTKGEVRGLDLAVRNLNTAERLRRPIGSSSS